MAFIDLTGQIFRKLTVIQRSEKRQKEREAYWDCICECGNQTRVRGSYLRNGSRVDCGCGARKRTTERQLIDVTGQVFNRLKVLEQGKTINNRIHWKCQCICGNIVEVDSYNLRHGITKSCGCLQKERTSEASIKNLKGKEFGMLTVLDQAPSRNGKAYWICQCECGKIKEIAGQDLMQGIKSCGCLRASFPEHQIEKALINLQIDYEKEKIFPNLYGTGGGNLRFDFFLPEQNILIEYQGEQHYRQNFKYDSTEEGFQKRQCHDEIKRQYCKENGIKLIEIPYWKQEDIPIILQKIKEDTFENSN